MTWFTRLELREARIAELARAIARAVDEHGAPNTFGLTELRVFHRAPSPSLAGKIARHDLERLQQALREQAKDPALQLGFDGQRRVFTLARAAEET